jgi:predicted RNA-binding Zn ribbon-like protein
LEPLELTHPDGQTFTFEPGSIAMAFAITGPGTNEGPLAIFQTLHVPADLDRWASDVAGARRVRASSADLDVALRLQAAIWSSADAVVDHRPIPGPAREALNELAAEPSLVPRLEAGPERGWARRQPAKALFSTIARDAIDVVAGPRAARLKRCEGARCAILFVDTSRPGRRRWCSMDRCGNRAKAAAHRRRRNGHRNEMEGVQP